MTHHESTDHTNHDHAADGQHDDVLFKTQGNPVPDAHDEVEREAPAGGDYTASESAEEKEAREAGA
jgi:hypothetical protein